MIDYYYLLKRGLTDDDRNETNRVLKQVGIYKFASAVMYVMKHILGIDDKFLLMPPNERIGRILVSEMLQGVISAFTITAILSQVNLSMLNIL